MHFLRGRKKRRRGERDLSWTMAGQSLPGVGGGRCWTAVEPNAAHDAAAERAVCVVIVRSCLDAGSKEAQQQQW